MKTNATMRTLLAAAPAGGWAGPPAFPPDVQDTLDAGWTVGPNGALLLAAHWRRDRHDIPADALGDGEHEVNDVFVSLRDLAPGSPAFLPRAAARCLAFAGRMLTESHGLPGSADLLATVSVSTDTDDEDFAVQGGTVRFFTRRGAHPGFYDDLEAFPHEALAVLPG